MANSDEMRPGSGRKGDISVYAKYLTDFISSTETNRKQQTIDVGYYHSDQLTDREIRILNKRKQPILIINRVRAAVNGILGVSVQKHTQPRAWPRTPQDEGSADVATDVLRYLKDSTNLKGKLVEANQNLLNAGVAGVVMAVDQKTKAVSVNPIGWQELIYDPRAKSHDFSDAKYMGIAKWMYADDIKQMYPKFDVDAVSNGIGATSVLDDVAGRDRPFDTGQWISQNKQRVLLVELHYQEGGQWFKAVFTGAGVLEEGQSWLTDGKGGYVCPIVAETVYVSDNNQRYGVVRDMRYLQDEINKRRSKLLHLLSVAQIQAKDPSAIEIDADAARDEAARPDGVIPFGWERVRNQDIVQGQAQLLAESKSELERMGPNPAILGRQGSDTSGKALAARQEAGMVELAIVFSRMDDLELRVYRALWLVVQQYWTAPQYVRVTDEVDDPRFVAINEPQMGLVQGVDQATGQPAYGPEGPIMVEDVLGYKNKIAEMDVDIILDVVPGTANLMAEQLATLMDLIARNPTYAELVPPEVLFELTPMPRKRELMAKIKAATETANQQKAQQAQMEQQIAATGAQAKIDETKSKTELNIATAHEKGFNAATYQEQTSNQSQHNMQSLAQKAQDSFVKNALAKRAQDLQQEQLAQQPAGSSQH